MATPKQKTSTSEVDGNKTPSEVQEQEKTVTITMDEYLKQANVNPLLVASFTYEGTVNNPEMFAPKTFEGWAEAFDAQSKRTYE